MEHPEAVLRRIYSPADLRGLSDLELDQLAAEMRSELIGVVGRRSAHFASNLGVVELCLCFTSRSISRVTALSGTPVTRSIPKNSSLVGLTGCTRFALVADSWAIPTRRKARLIYS